MRRVSLQFTPEAITLIVLQAVSVLALIFLASLVAKPKLLFGRALSAITPSLFPSIIITAIAIICAILLISMLLGSQQTENAEDTLSGREWLRGCAFFSVLILYALTMVPFGFFVSSVIALVLMSMLMGSRSIIQIVGLSVAAPVALYLAATRLLAVSLPELNVIELFYARLLGG